jgi:putative pyruvate formate lyase activating enzyme
MPALIHETRAIFEWLARDLSPDTFVNIMGQYRPENRVGERTASGSVRYSEINRRPSRDELALARRAAREAGLWRFD